MGATGVARCLKRGRGLPSRFQVSGFAYTAAAVIAVLMFAKVS